MRQVSVRATEALNPSNRQGVNAAVAASLNLSVAGPAPQNADPPHTRLVDLPFVAKNREHIASLCIDHLYASETNAWTTSHQIDQMVNVLFTDQVTQVRHVPQGGDKSRTIIVK